MKITLTKDVKVPERGTSEAAGLDFFVPNEFGPYVVEPGKSIKIPSGVKMVIPKGMAGIFMNKSSHGSKGILVGACVVDSDYRGEVHLDLHNVSLESFVIKPGMKIVQMIVQRVELEDITVITNNAFEAQADTERGEGGFGSTGA
tara:strand:+ start:11068 stop:11502 length:435 start_codon:yes stop_codon:yes gene_type:complete